MTVQTFTITNNEPSTIAVTKFVFDTPNTIDHSFNLSNFGGSSAFTGTQFTCDVDIASSASKSFTADYTNIASVPGVYTATIAVYIDNGDVLLLANAITVNPPTALPAGTYINPITDITPVFAEFYNTIKNQIEGILTDGYGFSGLTSVDRIAGQSITTAEWQLLVNDFQKIQVHQTGTIFDSSIFDSTVPSVDAINEFTAAVNTAFANSTTVVTSQVATSSPLTSTRTTTWGATISHRVTMTWTNDSSVRYFFNLGGKIDSQLSYTGSDSTWSVLMNTAIQRLANNTYKWSEFTNSNTTLYALGSGTTFTWSTNNTSRLAGSSVSNGIMLRVVRSTNTITYNFYFEVVGSPTINLLPSHSLYYTYSRGDVAVSGFTGVAAPIPSLVNITDLETGGSTISPPPVSTKVLSVSISSNSFTFLQDAISSNATVSVTNNGNTLVTISAINYSANGVTAIPNYAGLWGGSAATTIGAGVTKTFTLAYTGSQQGSYANNFTISSDNDSGPITVITNQTVGAPAYYFTVVPSSISVTLTTTQYAAAQLTITQFNGSYYTGPSSYDVGFPNLSGTNASSFILDPNNQAGPMIAFDPVGKANGTYTCNVNIRVNTYLVTVPISVVLAVPAAVNTNLGTWISGIQTTNAVLGFSYDIIQDQRYLTIGFGTGADGSPQITNGTTITGSYASVSNLSRTSDVSYTAGPIVYASQVDSGSGTFFQDEAVWIRSSSLYSGLEQSGPRNRDVSRTYYITIPTTGDYTWTVAGDYTYTLLIDDVTIFSGVGNYSGSDSDTVYLEAGTRKITWIVNGDKYGPTGIAVNIKRTSDSLHVWSTRDPFRPSTPFQNWCDVYRIPIAADGTAKTYLSKDYLIKSWQLEGQPYQYYFANNNLLQVDDNGQGELTITFNSNPTVNNDTVYYAHELLYYYSERSVRKSNIGSPEGDGSQTRWFRGFTKDGAVRTVLQSFPVNPPSGGGGGFYEGDQSSTIETQER